MNTACKKLTERPVWADTLLLLGVFLLVVVIPLFSTAKVHAQSGGAAISQGFQTESSSVTIGDLVSTDPNNQGSVQLANTDRIDFLSGVVEDKPLVTLSNGANEVQVATNGVAPVLVSDINGAIQPGDKLTASPINGIGMKATESTEIFGTAQEALSDVTTVPFAISDTDGTKRTVHIGLVRVQLGVAYYVVTNGQGTSLIPNSLQQIANSIAGHDVSVVRVLLSLLIILLGFVSAAIILYASVRSGIISVGRNPLAEKAIHKSLLEVIFVAVGILLAMVVSVYLVLAL